MNYKIVHTLALLFAGLLFCFSVSGQTLESGRKLYNDKKYAEAADIFEVLIKKTPSNAQLNQWYGVSLYELGKYKQAEKHLTTAAKSKVLGAYLYLGDLYMKTYQFDQAVSNYNKYLTAVTKSKDTKAIALVEQKLQKAEMGERMINRVEEVQIIDSLVVGKIDFFNNYKLSAQSGKLHNLNRFFNRPGQTDATVYQTQRGDKIIYGEASLSSNSRLFTRDLLPDGKWSEATVLPSPVNTTANENFPFLLTDGLTLYFGSDGSESLGGYDIFITRHNLNSGNYLAPENVGMPFNSPYNDYLMAIDELNNVGWFATDRFQPEDSVVIYTFIPNVEKKIYKNENPEHSRQLARIASIRDTWSSKAGYADLLRKIYSDESEQPKVVKGDFVFVVNDNYIYTFLHEFSSNEARNLYIKATDIRKQIARAESDLERLRQRYTRSKTDKKAAEQILKTEAELAILYGQPEEFEKQARNSEINAMKNQK